MKIDGLFKTFSTDYEYSLAELLGMYNELHNEILVVYIQITPNGNLSDRSLQLLQRLSMGKREDRLPANPGEATGWYKREIAHLLNVYNYIRLWPDGTKLLKIAEYTYKKAKKSIKYNDQHYYPKFDQIYISKYKVEIGGKVFKSSGFTDDKLVNRKGKKKKSKFPKYMRKKR